MTDFLKEYVMDERERAASDYADASENKHSCNQYLTGCCFSETAIEVAFMKGWDEANARAEKRIQELEIKLREAYAKEREYIDKVQGLRGRIKELEKALEDEFNRRTKLSQKCGMAELAEQALEKKIQSLEQQCKGLVEALEFYSKGDVVFVTGEINTDVARAALKQIKEQDEVE